MTPPHFELCNVRERASLHSAGRVLDVERRSSGQFTSDVMDALARWDHFSAWAQTLQVDPNDPVLDPAALGPCVPRPRQVFGIGLNYRDHARESNMSEPKQPMVFTKFPSCVSGPRAAIPLTSDTVDWEVELVVVIGREARAVAATEALQHVAGYCVGQDISDRRQQFRDLPPQFSLAKSAPGFGPIGPWLVPRAAVDASELALSCDVNGERMQSGNTRDMVFGVPELIAYLSARCTLLPGDLIFTGTPSGVGSGRKPPLYLQPGDVIRSEISGLGVLENRCERSAVWRDAL
jgi:2-keto-4-pentenoate hydratase/2-oxohepta-3-ene-1,7-dioic acid hydratase in catechol pathway